MFDMMKMLGKVKEVQEKMKLAQEKLVNIYATGEAGAGMVKATVNGRKQIVKLEIDPDLIKPQDADMLKDLIIASVNKALEEVEVKAQEEIRKSTEGMMPNIPGFDFSNFA